MTVQCCVCKRERVDGDWRPAGIGDPYRVTHTYCPACLAQARAEMQAELMRETRILAPWPAS